MIPKGEENDGNFWHWHRDYNYLAREYINGNANMRSEGTLSKGKRSLGLKTKRCGGWVSAGTTSVYG